MRRLSICKSPALRKACHRFCRALAKKLVLVHISPRYKKNKDVENEARQEFGNVVVPKDLEEVEV